MKITKIKEVLGKVVRKHMPVLLVSSPGMGKSDSVKQFTEQEGMELITLFPSMSDPTDFKGFPFANEQGGKFIPLGLLSKVLKAEKETVLFIDDIGQSTLAVQTSLMPVMLNRMVGEEHLPDCVHVVGATNRRGDMAGVQGLLEPLKSRFATILNVEFDLDEWKGFAIKANMPSELIAFSNFKPSFFTSFAPTKDLKNSPCPRTICHVGELWNLEVRDFESLAGACGEGYASEFLSFVEMSNQLPMFEDIVKEPTKIEIPKNTSVVFALCGMLAFRSVEENFDSIMTFVDRLPIEFQILFVKDAVAKNRKLITHSSFKSRVSKFAKVVFGE